MDAVGLRNMLLSQAGLPPEVSASIDFASRARRRSWRSRARERAGRCWRSRRAGATEAQKIIDALGKKIMMRGPATLVEGNTGGRGWL